MPRRPHVLSGPEILRLAVEHAVIVGLLLAGLVLSALLRDPALPSPLEPSTWPSPHAALVAAASFLVRLGRFGDELGLHLAWDSFAAALLQYGMYLNGLYDRQPVRRARLRLLRLVRAAVLAGIVLAVVFFFARPPELGRMAPAIGFTLAVGVLWAARSVGQAAADLRPESVLVLGSGGAVQEVAEVIAGQASDRYHVVGRIGGEGDQAGLPRLGDWPDLARLLSDRSPDRLLLASSPPGAEALGVVVGARLSGVAVNSASRFAEALSGEVREDDPGVEFITDGTAAPRARVSRLTDVLIAAAALVLLAPVLLLVGIAVLATSGRPVLFVQERVGLGGRTYACFKFRTMRKGVDGERPAWSPPGDPRVTRLGRFLRRWRLDELPQLWNVLRGDMAIVGPRPEQPYFVDRLTERLPHYPLRHLVRPGLTGWAQVKLPYASTEDEARRKLRHDLYYIKHRGPTMDLAILFDTVRVLLRGQGR